MVYQQIMINPLPKFTLFAGMFMVCARMVDKNGKLVSNSCRSSMLHYQSPFLKFLFICVNAPFLVFGYKEEKQTVLVELYSDFEEHQVIILLIIFSIKVS